MAVKGTIAIRCSACGAAHEAELVQSINARVDPGAKARLLAGELNTVACACGKRVAIACQMLYSDPDADYLCQVCPGGEEDLARGEAAFRASGATGRQRLVPSQNALVEKVKLLDADLEDWAIEMLKVLLLASLDDAARLGDHVLLFDGVDRAAGAIRWLAPEPGAAAPRALASPLAAYGKLVASARPPGPGELRIDRVWAVEAVRDMIARAN